MCTVCVVDTLFSSVQVRVKSKKTLLWQMASWHSNKSFHSVVNHFISKSHQVHYNLKMKRKGVVENSMEKFISKMRDYLHGCVWCVCVCLCVETMPFEIQNCSRMNKHIETKLRNNKIIKIISLLIITIRPSSYA